MGTWRQYDYGSYTYAGEAASASACGAFAIANVIDVDPTEVMSWLTNHGYAVDGQGTDWNGITACLNAYGYPSQMICSGRLGEVDCSAFNNWQANVKSGNMGILLMGAHAAQTKSNNYWTGGGHYIAIQKYDASLNKYYVVDSASTARDGWHPFSDFAGAIKNCYVVGKKWKKGTTIDVDGCWGCGTTKRAQQVFGTDQDGIVSNQNEAMKAHLGGCMPASWEFVPASKLKSGSGLVRAIQKHLGITADGFMGIQTITALQKMLGVTQDGYFGNASVKAFQSWLNQR